MRRLHQDAQRTSLEGECWHGEILEAAAVAGLVRLGSGFNAAAFVILDQER